MVMLLERKWERKQRGLLLMVAEYFVGILGRELTEGLRQRLEE